MRNKRKLKKTFYPRADMSVDETSSHKIGKKGARKRQLDPKPYSRRFSQRIESGGRNHEFVTGTLVVSVSNES
jgi:hypothetical protein